MAGKEGIVHRFVEFTKNIDLVTIPVLFALAHTPLGAMYPNLILGGLAASIASFLGGALIQDQLKKGKTA